MQDDTWVIETNGFIHRDESLEGCLYYILNLFERETDKRIVDTCCGYEHLTIHNLVKYLMTLDKYHVLEVLHIYIRDMFLDPNLDQYVDIICEDTEDEEWIVFNK